MSHTQNKKDPEIIGMAWANCLLANAFEWTKELKSFPNDAFISQEARAILMVGHSHNQQQERIAIEHAEILRVSAEEHAALLRGLAVTLDLLIEKLLDIQESIDCAGSTPTEFWLTSDIAAIDKAKELSIEILPKYTTDDLRNKIHRALDRV